MRTSQPVLSQSGVAFVCVLVEVGDAYGAGRSLIATVPMLEFYDTRYPKFGPNGQFVSRYSLDTMRECAIKGQGLTLCGGVPEWRLDAAAFAALTWGVLA